jgi:plastocyanin
VHSAATALITVVAAEKSKVPFFIGGGLLAAWAIVLSVLLGLRKPSFPYGPAGQRSVIAISVVLVAAAISTAVLTSGSPPKSGEASAAASSTPAASPAASQAGSSSAGGSAASTSTAPSAPAAPSAGGASSSVSLAAVPNAIAYNTKTLAAKAGKVTITLSNAGALEHNVTIAQGSTVLGATPTFTGGAKSVTLTLKPGTYTFYCSVPGHRAAGMEGVLKVT